MNSKYTKAMVVAAALAGFTQTVQRADAALDYRFYGSFFTLGEGIPGSAVSDLLASDDFPGNPITFDLHPAEPFFFTDEQWETSGFVEWPQSGDAAFATGDSGSDNYGAAVSGILYPPVSGTYTFHVRSDDASALYLSTDENFLDPRETSPIARESGCCGGFDREGEAASLPIALEVGQGYAFEMLWKEGGGGDWMQVGWSLNGGSIEEIPAYYIQRDVRYGASNADGITGPGTADLGDVQADEGLPFQFIGVEFDKEGVAAIQWQWNASGDPDNEGAWENIPADAGIIGSQSPAISWEISNLEWNEYFFRPVVDGETGDPIELEVEEDDRGPNVVNVQGLGTAQGGGILVVFDEIVDEASALDTANYAIAGKTVDSVRKLSGTEYLLDIGVFEAEALEVTISGITDIAAARNMIDEETWAVSFASEEFQVLIFDNMVPRIGGGSAANLLANVQRVQADPRFPGDPSHVGSLTGGEFNVVQSDALLGGPNLSDFAGFTFGRLVIEEAGDYQLAIRSDDPSLFYLSTDETTLNLPPIDQPTIAEGGCCGALGDNGGGTEVATVTLAEGEYAFEAYYFEFGGGDYLEIGWRRNDTDTWVRIPEDHLVQQVATGVLSFVEQPQSVTVLENRPYDFNIAVTGSDKLGLGYQWLKNGEEIADATAPMYAVNRAALADDGAVIEAVAFNVNGTFSPVTSAQATLTVDADVVAPQLVSVLATDEGFQYRIVLEFDEVVALASAEEETNYIVTGPNGAITVETASLAADEMTVTLFTSAFTAGDALTIQALGVTDIAAAANASDSTLNAVVSGVSIFQNGLNDYDGVRDTQIRGATPDRNDGEVVALNPDGSDGGRPVEILIQFQDLFGSEAGQVPTEFPVLIESATLILDNFGPGSNQELYQMFLPWDENEVVWNDFPGDDGVPKDDVSASSTPDVTFATPVAILEIPIPASTIQNWKDGVTENYGWVTEPLGTDGVDFHASEANDPTQGPKLEIVWTPVVAGAFEIVTEPVDASAAELVEGYTFFAEIVNPDETLAAWDVQWFKNGVAIEGARELTYSVENALLTDNGAQFQLIATNRESGVTAESAVATLSVVADEVAPAIVSVSAVAGEANTVVVVFNEDVDMATAEDAANYRINGASVSSAVLADDMRAVTLTVDVLEPSQDLNVVVTGVLDLAAGQNAADAAFGFVPVARSVFQNGLNGYEGTADTQVRGATPNRNDGDFTALNPDGSDDGAPVQILIRFDDMFGDAAGQIPMGASIQSARLYLDTTNPGSDQILYQMTQAWDEDAVVWNDFDSTLGIVPGVHAAIEADVTFPAPAEVLEIDIPASTIQAWLDGDTVNNGWMTVPTGGNGQDFFASEFEEVARRPRLEIDWNYDFTVAFQDGLNGYEGTSDTQVRGATPDRNDGDFTALNPDGSDDGAPVQILIRFDDLFGEGAGQIPAGVTIVSTQLFLDTTNPGSDQQLHQMLEAWDEDVVVWNDFDPADGIVPGVHAEETPDVIFPTPAEVLEIDIPASTVQAWLDGDKVNNGWMTVPTGGNGQDFFASEFEEVARRPKLEVVYRTVDNTPELPEISVSLVNGELVIEFANGALYSADSVTGPYAPVNGATSPFTVAPTAAQAFFTVR